MSAYDDKAPPRAAHTGGLASTADADHGHSGHGATPGKSTHTSRLPTALAGEGQPLAEPGEATAHHGFVGFEAHKQADHVARADFICETAQKSATETLSSLVPAYLAARDALDVAATEELGTRLIAALTAVRGATHALDATIATLPRASARGGSLDEDIAQRETQEAVRAKRMLVESL